MSTSSGYRVSENGSSSDKDNVFYERVRTYSPVTKMVQVLDSSPGPLSPIRNSPSPGYQSGLWSTEQQHHHKLQEVQSPYTQQETIRRYTVQNTEQEVQSPYTQQETIRRYTVQNNEQEIQAPYQHGTIRRYIVQNPEQQTYLKNMNYIPTNNVIYEKTIRRVDVPNQEVDRLSQSTRTMSVSSGTEQVIEQSKTSVQSTEQEIVPVQNTQQKVSIQINEQNVEKIGARKLSDSDNQVEDIESLIPKGVSELTKQQIRYLLQMRQTSDKSMRLVLSTFANLREELVHLQDHLNKLETDKKSLERDLTFKDCQIKEYENILATLREKNQKQQQELKDRYLTMKSLEEQILTLRNSDTDRDYRFKELEYAKNAMQKENQTLRLQITETCSSPMLQTKADEISKQYMEMISNLRDEKDKEIRNLRIQITKFQHDVMTREGSSSDLQSRLLELTSSLDEKESLIKRQQEELFRLRQERESKGLTKAIITKKYRNQYPILGLLSDYRGTSPVKESQTIVIERTGEMWKHE
ncbi:hypothetical protein GDO86_015478 [Hymenochirus boettgeri]|uniref:POF1B helix-loop-helix domain-containing protein n=1 Tax=Hymenochirus boettgeri TaxID=247094 RepID=A0A8T2JWM9_9PIPI|nr:hypothetical protein GDO86_015478 [Hymenochirus boettgeri]